MKDAGTALMGIGFSASGENRARDAAERALRSPLIETDIGGAKGILLSIAGGDDLSLFEVNEAAEVVRGAATDDTNIIFGATIDDRLTGQVWVTVVATGFGARAAQRRITMRARGRTTRAPWSRRASCRARPSCHGAQRRQPRARARAVSCDASALPERATALDKAQLRAVSSRPRRRSWSSRASRRIRQRPRVPVGREPNGEAVCRRAAGRRRCAFRSGEARGRAPGRSGSAAGAALPGR